MNMKLTPAAILLAASANAQDCSLLDLNGCGCVDIFQYSIMLQLVVDGGPSAGDFDQDGDTDAADLAFFAANFASCANTGTLSTGLPEQAPSIILDIEPVEQPDGSMGYEILMPLPSADAELVGVTRARVTQGTDPAFQDTSASAGLGTHLPLPQSVLDAQQVPFDSFIAIGDRSGEPSPVAPLAIDLDLNAYENDRVIDAPNGWTADITVVGTPASPGLGGADGNTDNRVLLASLATSYAVVDMGVAYAHGGRLYVADARATINANPCVADVIYDTVLTPIDFTGWINAFNDGRAECDQNADGLCNAGDFTAWIANYNAGCP